MIRAITLSGRQLYCGRPGCREKLDGIHYDTSMSINPSAWWGWDAAVQPIRLERRQKASRRLIQDKAHGGRRAVDIPLPCEIVCPRCRAVQRIDAPAFPGL